MLFPCCSFSCGPLADKREISVIRQGGRIILKEGAIALEGGRAVEGKALHALGRRGIASHPCSMAGGSTAHLLKVRAGPSSLIQSWSQLPFPEFSREVALMGCKPCSAIQRQVGKSLHLRAKLDSSLRCCCSWSLSNSGSADQTGGSSSCFGGCAGSVRRKK